MLVSCPAREHSARRSGELAQQAEFDRWQIERPITEHDPVLEFVDRQSQRLRLQRAMGHATKNGLHPGDDLRRAGRLADVVIRSELEPEQAVDLLDPRGDDDDRQVVTKLLSSR
jgi:hypothetical protein